jgi:hypothetical protein
LETELAYIFWSSTLFGENNQEKHIWDLLITANIIGINTFVAKLTKKCKTKEYRKNMDDTQEEENEQLKKSVQNWECQVLWKLMKSRQIARKQKH